MRLHFQTFGMDDYQMFLRAKALTESQTVFHVEDETYSVQTPARFAAMLGLSPIGPAVPELALSDFLFEDQRAICTMALNAKRFACWSDCGLGKTLIELEFARQVLHRTGGRVLLVTLNEIVPQTMEECKRFYADMPIHLIANRAEMRQWCKDGEPGLAITNYEKWNPGRLEDQVVNEARHLSGVILDESSRLKGGGGKQKWALIKSCKGIEYKLSATATPAPNDIIEFASQASFLEKMRSEGDIIWSYFVRDPVTHRWTVKPHARAQFFRWMSSWSIYVRNPKCYGWRLNMPEVPEPVVRVHKIEMTPEQAGQRAEMICGDPSMVIRDDECATNAIQRLKLSQLAKGFRYRTGEAGKYDRVQSRKPDFVSELIQDEAKKGHQVLVWTSFDAESELLAEALGDANYCILTGKTKEKDRLEILESFRVGKVRVLLSRAAVLGYGINLQCCTSMIFSGWSDSYEAYYQAVRRAYRYGQTQRLRVHIPVIEELEGDMLDNIFRKQEEHESAIAEMQENYINVLNHRGTEAQRASSRPT